MEITMINVIILAVISLGALYGVVGVMIFLSSLHDKAVERDLKGQHKILKGIQSEEC